MLRLLRGLILPLSRRLLMRNTCVAGMLRGQSVWVYCIDGNSQALLCCFRGKKSFLGIDHILHVAQVKPFSES